ncbi:glycosyltransferase family 4 protein [Streptomyces sp. NPDC059786]|uniref:glycosyltransferase family 4 protein n=1 Tax=Streptomyces sp. NPDC059786 TaxID=3346946 RepID=UPI0036562C64
MDGYGSATALRTFVDSVLAHSCWRVTLVVPDQGLPPTVSGTGRVERAPLMLPTLRDRRLQLAGYAAFVAARGGVGLTSRPDVVISWQPLPAGLAGQATARRYGVPHIVRTCGPELSREWSRFPWITSLLRPLTQRLFGGADAVIVKSELEQSLVGDAAEASRVHLIPNAVADTFFAPGQPSADGSVRFLVACQLEPHKAPWRLIEAFTAVQRTSSQRLTLTVVGDGSLRRRLEEASAQLQGIIEFKGRIPHGAMPGVYTCHDAFIMPSPLEGCSNAALEAMAAGLPVIGMKSALSDLIEDGVHGFLCDSPGTDGLRGAMDQFLDRSETDRESLGHAARAKAQNHTTLALIRAYGHLIEELSCETTGNLMNRV